MSCPPMVEISDPCQICGRPADGHTIPQLAACGIAALKKHVEQSKEPQ